MAVATTPSWSQNGQLGGLNGWQSQSIFTIGQSVGEYTPLGIPDGMGAIMLNESKLRLFVNHELTQSQGYSYTLGSGVTLIGSRISYFDLSTANFQVLGAGVAYNDVYDRSGNLVTDANQVNESGHPTNGMDRFCSGGLFKAGRYNLVDDIYFAGLETSNGLNYALNVSENTSHALS